jgi:hypothetical protein
MFSLVSEKVLHQPPSAIKKKQYEIHNVLGTGAFGKVMVRDYTSGHPHAWLVKADVHKMTPYMAL